MKRVDKVIAILPTNCRRDMMERSVAAVLGQTRKVDQFIVLDNASKDGTREVLAKYAEKHKELLVIRSETNLGAGGGMLFLIKEALARGADWVWFIDDDAESMPDALEELEKVAKKSSPDVAMLEAMVLDGEGVWSGPNRPARFDPKTFAFNGIGEDDIKNRDAVEVHTGGYNGWFVRASCFAEFGLPREDLWFWFDDVEYVVRVSRSKKVLLVPAAKIKHYATSLVPHEKRWPFSGPLPKIPEQYLGRYFYWTRNWLWFAHQWLPAHKYPAFWAKHVVRGLAAPLLFGQDHLVKRWGLVLTAATDGWRGKLGRKKEIE